MTLGKLMKLAPLAGLAAGVIMFTLFYAFRDAFEAAASLRDISPRASGGAGAIILIPSLVIGVGIAVYAARSCEISGAILIVPLIFFVAAQAGACVFLLVQTLHPVPDSLVGAPVASAVVTFAAAAVRGWMESNDAGP